MRKVLTLAVAVVLLMALPMASATATPPVFVEFDVVATFGAPTTGTFTADGALMCPGGTTEDLSEKFAGESGNVQVITTFTCAEGGQWTTEDTFIMKMQAHFDEQGEAVLTWVIKGGTGFFEGAHGTGSGEGGLIFDPFPIGAWDVRTGTMHID